MGFKMKIIIDSREKLPYTFHNNDVGLETAKLNAGDYSLAGFDDRVAVERKSLDDLVGCLHGSGRERFERELARAGSYERFAVIIESSLQHIIMKRYHSKMTPQSVIQSITAFYIRYGSPFLFCGDRSGGEYMTYSILSKYQYEIEKRFMIIGRN